MPDPTDRNLLYGVLALQMGFVDRDALISGLQIWVTAKTKPLSQILQDQRAIARKDHPAVEYAVRRHLEKSQYDATQCLTSLDVELAGSVRSLLREIDDSDLQRTLRNVESEESRRLQDQPCETSASPSPDTAESAQVIDLRRFFDEDAKPDRPRYRHLRPHAKGGLGEVFLAWDEEVSREVALKEIRPEFANDERLRSRFVREAEVNGNLEHPGIVPVYGLGVYPDGRPFYAMRFVEGESLHAAVTRLHLDRESITPDDFESELRKLLRAMIDVCHAVAYAHSRGVLHRDLKPANILLGTFGETLIIDWGLAKVLDKGDAASSVGAVEPEPIHLLSSESSLTPTIAGETLGSPPYMSPEQARGEHETLDKASDIYSLGATLYAVLTGQPPVTDKQVKTILKKVMSGDIPRPTAVNPRVPQSLEAICMKAMAMEPRQRYSTSHGLADDLENWLADRPVTVYRDALSTRLMRWARHHRTIVATGLVVMLAGLSGLSIITAVISEQKRQVEKAWGRESVARRVAEKAREDAVGSQRLAGEHLRAGLDVIEQLVILGDRRLATTQSMAERKAFLDTAISFIGRFQRRDVADADIEAKAALLTRQLANLERATGDYEKADRLYADSAAILQSLSDPEDSSPRFHDLLAETLLERGQTWLDRGRAAEALKNFTHAREISEANAHRQPSSTAFKRTLGRGLYLEGAAQLALGEAGAVQTLRAAVHAYKPIADATLPQVPGQLAQDQTVAFYDQTQLTAALCHLGTALRQTQARESALSLQRQALERLDDLTQRLEGQELADLDLFRAWAEARIAETLAESSDHEAAEEILAKLNDAVDRLEALRKSQPDVSRYSEYLADALMQRARAHLKADRPEPAAIDIRRSRTLVDPLIESNDSIPEYQNLLGQILLIEGDLARRHEPSGGDTARKLYQQAFAVYELALAVLPKNYDLLKGHDACRARLSSR